MKQIEDNFLNKSLYFPHNIIISRSIRSKEIRQKNKIIDISFIMFSLDELSVFFYSYYIFENGIFILPRSKMKRKGEKEKN